MKITMFTDGGARGNPGPAGIGVVICNDKGEIVKKYGEFLGDDMTNNEAEYGAVIFGLKKLKALLGKDKVKQADVMIKADSELMVKQMTGQYRLTDRRIQDFFITIWNLKIEFNSVDFKHIPREQNSEADKLVNEALDNRAKSNPIGLF